MKKNMLLVAAIAGILPAASAVASPLVNLRLLGKNITRGDAGYTASVQAAAGDQISLELVAEMAPVGTTNTNGSRTITSETSGTDGVNSLKVNVYDPNGASAPVGDDLVTILARRSRWRMVGTVDPAPAAVPLPTRPIRQRAWITFEPFRPLVHSLASTERPV